MNHVKRAIKIILMAFGVLLLVGLVVGAIVGFEDDEATIDSATSATVIEAEESTTTTTERATTTTTIDSGDALGELIVDEAATLLSWTDFNSQAMSDISYGASTYDISALTSACSQAARQLGDHEGGLRRIWDNPDSSHEGFGSLLRQTFQKQTTIFSDCAAGRISNTADDLYELTDLLNRLNLIMEKI